MNQLTDFIKTFRNKVLDVPLQRLTFDVNPTQNGQLSQMTLKTQMWLKFGTFYRNWANI